MSEDLLTGLDYRFLRYIDVLPETQKRNQSFYLPFFEECHKIVDLGCGDGDFVELLVKQGKEALGVDSDAKACEVALQRDIPIVCEDVFTYLEGLPPDGLDAIFSSHLVEHLPYQKVLQLFQLSRRALRPGGIIVVTTPNVRGLYSHLEMFWLHFGHVNFYHPRLLCFFGEQVGLVEAEWGENPHTASPLMSDLRAHFAGPRTQVTPAWHTLSSPPPADDRLSLPIDYDRVLPMRDQHWWRKLVHRVKMFMARMIVQPYLDQMLGRLNIALDETDRTLALLQTTMGQLQSETQTIASQLQFELESTRTQLQSDVELMTETLLRLDHPFECYVSAKKPPESFRAPEGD